MGGRVTAKINCLLTLSPFLVLKKLWTQKMGQSMAGGDFVNLTAYHSLNSSGDEPLKALLCKNYLPICSFQVNTVACE